MKISTLSFIIFVLFTINACQTDDISYTTNEHSLLKVSVSANALTLPEVDKNTRTNGVYDENSITELQLIAFDENDIFMDRYPVTDGKANIPHSTLKRSVYVIANGKNIIDVASADWTKSLTTMDQVLESLYQERSTGDMPALPFAMFGKCVFPKGINNNSAITSDGTHTGTPLLLKRNVAKISVTVGAELSKTFSIKRLMLCKAPTSGYLIKNTIRNANIFDNYKLSNAGNPLYSYVSSPETTIIIEAEVINNEILETRYFKIAIKESQAQGANGLKQNNWYKITLIRKTGLGFATLEDAINGHVFDHIDATLDILDITMHDFIFGTDFFIATSNSIYEQYGHKIGDNNYEICKVRFANTLDNDAVLGNTSIEVVRGAIELDANTVALISQAKNHVTYSILGRFTEPNTKGIIRLNFKNISKDIIFEASQQLDLRYDQFIEMPNSVVGSIIDQSLTWCGINDEKAFTQNKHLDINAPEGRILYLTVQNNANLFEYREATAMFARTKAGMTKVCIYQNPDNNIIYLSDNGVLSVGNASKATPDKMLFFKFGSVIGFNNPINGGAWDNTYIKYNPSNYEVGNQITVFDQNFDLPGIPCYNDLDLSGKLSVTSPSYHNASNIRKGKGDPCVLVGLTNDQIKNMSDDALNKYQSGYRMPTNQEQLSFSGLPGNDNNYTKHWWSEFPDNKITGAEFPERKGYLGYFLPAAGYITPQGERLHKESFGYYWTNHVAETIPGWGESPFCLEFNREHVNPSNGQGYFSEGMPIRCVRSR